MPRTLISLVSLSVAVLLVAAPSAAAKKSPSTERDRLWSVFDQHWEWLLKEHPELATRRGDYRYNDRWTDSSLAAIEAREKYHRELLARMKAFQRARLEPADQLNLDLFIHNLEREIEG